MVRWKFTKRTPSRKEQQAALQAQQRANCRYGQHTLTSTFRAGERLCLACGIVLSCPLCVTEHALPPSCATRVYPVPCTLHTQVEVRA